MITFDNTFETMEVECDKCSHQEELEGDYMSCIEEMKSNGWKIKKLNDEWVHYCTECQ